MNFAFIFPPFFGFGFILYFLPSIIALARSKRNTLSIFLLNCFLGWTLVGWVVALVWAVKADDYPAPVRYVNKSPSPWFKDCRMRVADFCRTTRQINTSASSTVRSAKSNPMDALQTW